MENDKNSESSKNNKGIGENKLANKFKTAPPVRQTLTSYKRMLKANPLLKYQEAGIDVDQLMTVKPEGKNCKNKVVPSAAISRTGSSSENRILNEFKKPDALPLKRTQSLKLPKSSYTNSGIKTISISGNLPFTNNQLKKQTSSTSLSNNSNTNSNKCKSESDYKFVSNKANHRPVENTTKNNNLPKNSKSKSETGVNKGTRKTEDVPVKQKVQTKDCSSFRRTLSSDSFQNNGDGVLKPKPVVLEPNNVHRDEQMKFFSSTKCLPDISPITNESSSNFIFKSPSAYARRSICSFTPCSAVKNSQFRASTPASVDTQHLQERLLKWSKSRGILISSSQHLRYFGKKKIISDTENKENIKADESDENSKIVTTPEVSIVELSIQDEVPESELPRVAKNAMVELQELIKQDFPGPQCLGWLEVIQENYRKANEEPEYWECKAAIEQSIGNVGNAVEFYKNAIIQGAEVSSVDKSLDQLLKKFSLLNISPNTSKSKKEKFDGDKERIVREARNIFKSTIIQCAVHERKLKK